MPGKASGKPKTKRIQRPQANGDIYIYDVTTLYNPAKRYNEHVSTVFSLSQRISSIECSSGVDLKAVCEQMSRSPEWMPDILLRADGYETMFYKKD